MRLRFKYGEGCAWQPFWPFLLKAERANEISPAFKCLNPYFFNGKNCIFSSMPAHPRAVTCQLFNGTSPWALSFTLSPGKSQLCSFHQGQYWETYQQIHDDNWHHNHKPVNRKNSLVYFVSLE